MGDKVFINGRSAVHAGSSGQSTCFPDVNLCPPSPPAGPVPLPLPNMARAADLQGGASSVLIEGNPMGKKSSFFAKSTGNEVAQSTGGGVVSHVVQGKAYFVSYSMDITVEGEEVPRHLDMMTHNHAAPSPPNAAMGTYLGMMDPAAILPVSKAPEKRKDDGKPQAVEFFVDHIAGRSAQGADSLSLVSSDGQYDRSMPLSAATMKGGLLCIRFERVLPRKQYSLYWHSAGERVPFFENVPFADIAEHTPGAEKAKKVRTPRKRAAKPSDDAPEEAPLPAIEHPDDWYDLPRNRGK